jgi:hypothetical protein
MTNGQPISLEVKPLLRPQDQIFVSHTFAVQLMWGALSEERMGLSFVLVILAAWAIYIYSL